MDVTGYTVFVDMPQTNYIYIYINACNIFFFVFSTCEIYLIFLETKWVNDLCISMKGTLEFVIIHGFSLLGRVQLIMSRDQNSGDLLFFGG